jgi:hypothetical protein
MFRWLDSSESKRRRLSSSVRLSAFWLGDGTASVRQCSQPWANPVYTKSHSHLVDISLITHTFWNGRIEWIRPLILSGLAGWIFEGF